MASAVPTSLLAKYSMPVVPAVLINPALGLTVVVCAAGFLLWWARERRLAQQRRRLRALYRLSEEIVSARSPADIIRILKTTLPRVSPDAAARLYLLHRHTNTLDLESGREIGRASCRERV